MAEGTGARCAALVGHYLSGKTSLMEALLFTAGATNRKGTIKEGNTVGDSSPVARKRQMSIEFAAANCQFMGDDWTLIDCPGSVEFAQEALNVLPVVDIAVVVCEADPSKTLALAPLFKFLDDHKIPHIVFINKLDHAHARISDVMEALQAVSQRPLVLRQVPIQDGDDVTGYVDLISERAYSYKPGESSALIEIPDSMQAQEQVARQELLEVLADFDDTLLEQLLEDVVPEKSEVYKHLSATLAEDNIVPVLLGSGDTMSGVFRLWKSLRHDTPPPSITAVARGFTPDGNAMAQVFKTHYAAHTGKLSIARVWSGTVAEGSNLAGSRVAALYSLFGEKHSKLAKAGPGSIIALGRMEEVERGDVLTAAAKGEAGDPLPSPLKPVYAFAINTTKREDEVKLSGAIQKLVEEDPSYRIEHNPDTHELVLWGQGEIHLAVARENLLSKYNIDVTIRRPQIPYKETIRRPIEQHARHKKQSGGHGQFGDVKIEIKPQARGAGFEFANRIVGGSVPRQFIPSVEAGIREYLNRGRLGFLSLISRSACSTASFTPSTAPTWPFALPRK